jgi:hypothetical protein
MEHVLNHMTGNEEYKQRIDTYDKKFDKAEERKVILGSEKETAKANGESIRFDHQGKPFETDSPISTKIKREL